MAGLSFIGADDAIVATVIIATPIVLVATYYLSKYLTDKILDRAQPIIHQTPYNPYEDENLEPVTQPRSMKTEDTTEEDKDVNGVKVPDDERTSDDPLRKSKHGHAEEDPEAAGTHHTQLGTRQGRKGAYRQGREFKNGEPEWDYDMTDHGRPQNHPNPHKHKWEPNPTGAKSRGKTALPID